MKVLALGLCLTCTFFVAPRTFATEISLPAGTVVSVTLADPIDSDHDAYGKQYAASVNIVEGQAIPAGSRATIVLLRNNSGWLTQLTGLAINGRKFQVLSGAGAVIGPDQAKASPTNGILQQMGLATSKAPTPNERVLLPSATKLSFRLIGSATPAGAVPVSSSHRAATRNRRSPSLSSVKTTAEPQQESADESGSAYLCSARDTPTRAVPISYYISDVFDNSDNQALVERRWHEYLIATYPYRFANNSRAVVLCSRLTDSAAGQDARTRLEGELRSTNAEVVQTRWHYTLGPPPASGGSTVPSSHAP